MIEIKKVSDKSERLPARYGVFIDGTSVNGIDVQTLGIDDDAEPHTIVTTTQDATDQLLVYSFLELQKLGPMNLRLHYRVEWNEALGQVWLFGRDDEETYSAYLFFSNIDRWHRAYSFDEYFRTFRQHLESASVTNISVEDTTTSEYAVFMPFNVFVISLSTLSKTNPIHSELYSYVNALGSLHENVKEELESRFPIDSLEISFSFPEEVRVPCEQYLLYFVEFLKDIGVEATADLRHEAEAVLFSVTPKDKATALDNVRTALGSYLQLPSSPTPNDSFLEIEEQRLAASVEHLRGQIRLKVAEIQLKDATIQMQKTTIDYLLNPEVLLNSVTHVEPRTGDEKEALLGGLVALTKHNYKGLEVNYPEVFRWLRKLFKRDKN